MTSFRLRTTALSLCGLVAIQLSAQEGGAPPPPPPAAPPAAPASAPRFVPGSADAAVAGTRSKRQIQVAMDEATRSLIITTDPATYTQVQAVLKGVDQPVAQALIKVLFLEVTHTNTDDLGLSASYDHTSKGGGTISALSTITGLAGQTGGNVATLQQDDLKLTLAALAKVGKTNVLSRPSILARNNQQATITIGQEVPFITNSRIDTNNTTINTVEYQDIGIILTVTPHIGSDGRIELDVAPEITTLSADTVPISNTINAPIIAKRAAETHVVVPSGKTIVIGGLMEDLNTESVNKIPVLGDIWLLGALFRHTVKEKTKRELLIFLTPTLVDTGTSLVALSAGEQQHSELIRRETDDSERQRYLDAPVPAPDN